MIHTCLAIAVHRIEVGPELDVRLAQAVVQRAIVLRDKKGLEGSSYSVTQCAVRGGRGGVPLGPMRAIRG